LVEKGKHAEIRKRLGLDEAGLERALEALRTLNPFPGRAYSPSEVRFVVPDLMVKPREGDFAIVINDEEIPVLGIDPFFSSGGGASGKRDKATGEFIKSSLRDARFFIQSIHQRNRTLLKVARAIVEFQRNFFMKGPKYLVPLTLKDIASEIGVHETTVSRIANGKYVQTEWGIYELRHFFTNSISGAGSGDSRYSKEGVKEIIREIIQAEDKPCPSRTSPVTLARRGIQLAAGPSRCTARS
jgi:RNA polymerase sigma-54 factor